MYTVFVLCVEGSTGRRLRDEYSTAGGEVCRPDDVRHDDVLATSALSHPHRFTTLGALPERRKGPLTTFLVKIECKEQCQLHAGEDSPVGRGCVGCIRTPEISKM